MITIDYPVEFDINTLNVGDRVMVNHPFIKGPFVVVPENWPHSHGVVIRPSPGKYLVLSGVKYEPELPPEFHVGSVQVEDYAAAVTLWEPAELTIGKVFSGAQNDTTD